MNLNALQQSIGRLAHCCRHLGSACWLLTAQFFIAQIAAARAAQPFYSWGADPISYLGVTQCTVLDGVSVCSPLHSVFNLSLIGLGVATAIGAFLLYQQSNRSRGTRIGFGAIVSAAVGTILVGAFPTNTVYAAHCFGAALTLIGGSVGMLTLGIALRGLPGWLRYVMMAGGIISLTGLIFLASNVTLGFVLMLTGAAERMASYPGVVSLIVFGAYILSRRLAGRAPGIHSP